MKIDTSTYYPEVPDGDGFSLNREDKGLFGSSSVSSVDKEDEMTHPAEDTTSSGMPSNDPQTEPEREVPPTDVERFVSGVSHVLSWVLVPLLMPVYGLILAFNLSILQIAPMGTKVGFVAVVFGINVLIPMLLVLVLKKMGLVDDLGLNGRKERLIPYIISIVALAGTAVFMAHKGAPDWLVWFYGGGAVAGVVNMIVNFWWKISAHAAGIGGVVALLVVLAHDGNPYPSVFGWLIASIILAGMLGSARVWLGRHTVWQVMAGLTVGFLCVFLLS